MLQVQTAAAAAQLAAMPCYMQSMGPQPSDHLQALAPDWPGTVVPGNQQQQVQALSLRLQCCHMAEALSNRHVQ